MTGTFSHKPNPGVSCRDCSENSPNAFNALPGLGGSHWGLSWGQRSLGDHVSEAYGALMLQVPQSKPTPLAPDGPPAQLTHATNTDTFQGELER